MSFLPHLSNEVIGVTWRASLLIVLVFALRPFLTRWLPAKALPWLWLIVAGKLLLISAPAAWWSLYNLTSLGRAFSMASPPTSSVPMVDLADRAAPGRLSPLPAISTVGWSWDWALFMPLVWFLGMAVLATAQIVACIRFQRQLAGEDKLSGSRWRPLLKECADVTGVKAVPFLIETNLVSSPAVIGLLRPRLLVPHGLLDRLEMEEVRLVFIHELSHLRRRDLWLLTLFAITRTIHWFNPLVWLAERALRVDCEAACDAEVLRLTSTVSQHYGHTLLRLTQLGSGKSVSVLVAAISTNSNQTERRLRLIMKYHKTSVWMSLVAFALVVITGALTLPNEVTAQDNPTVEPLDPSMADPTANNSDDDQVIADLSRAIQAKPQDAQAYFRRAYAYMHKGDDEQAISDLSRAIQLKPQFAQAYFRRAFVYMIKGSYDLAISDLNQAVRINPKYARAYFRRAYVYMIKGSYDQAISDLNQTIQIDPKYTQAYDRRTYVYLLNGNYDKVVADYEQAIQINPQNANAYQHLAWFLATCPQASSRDGKKAVKDATTACELTEWKDSGALDTLAAACAETGDFNNAVKWENQAISNPGTETVEAAEKSRLDLYQSQQPYHVDQYDPNWVLNVK